MQNTPPDPDTKRFLQDLNELREIGRFKTGVHRPTYSADDMRSRHWLAERMTEVGLEPVIDGVGNVFGRSSAPGPKLLVGSHIESQNEAGWLDGALGVMAAVALARAGVPCDCIAFVDEEGHYGSFIGSRSFTGLLPDSEVDGASNRYHGKPMRDALREAGLEGKPRVALEPGRYKAFLEMHIEQGTTLEKAGQQIGVVTGIVAIWQYRILFTGMQDHAGGTTMAERKDAGLAAVRLLAWLDQEFPKHCGSRTVWTCGRISVQPGAASIIPGSAEVLFQFRDIDVEVLERLDLVLRRGVQEVNRQDRCEAVLHVVSQSRPAPCDPAIQDALAEAAEALTPGRWQRMPSGAGHDAQYMARVMPAGMIFVPSIGGISHHWAEDTAPEDLEMGIRVMVQAARRYLEV